ncbi:hypothetical protein [Clostridium sp. BJN0001]|uniref:hypothetical protein n=1 Tax=Clostridium sp. BJN0001 TaxID=2930219 RepID=UPI001FD2282F|nr:hypothetical protein [Clostridium sp. BJN0001]
MKSRIIKYSSEENKRKAYKELIQELNEEVKDRKKTKERLEIEYFKKFLLNIAYKDKYKEEVVSLQQRIEEIEDYIIDLPEKIKFLENNFDSTYGK